MMRPIIPSGHRCGNDCGLGGMCASGETRLRLRGSMGLSMMEDVLQSAWEVPHMATAEERLEVLKMVQSGQISADEGAK
ncbi:MAG: hypothetical protein PVJ55_09825, partial [Anaerolineae bacterium]